MLYMLALRLPAILEDKLEEICRSEKKTKSELLREAIELYFEAYQKRTSAYELGKEFFGKYGSGVKDNSENYKKRLKEKWNAKRST
ncbi:MAG: ribbon-helix-helix protein, CopG family [Leptospiraceae bacterium]|nr:ribbon-helix-helix protein, CopG family [Leptospiraceae bacterium]